MSLGKEQERFAGLLPGLVTKAIEIAAKRGGTVRLGDLFRDPRVHGELGVKLGYGHANSCHKLKLALDINIIIAGQITLIGHNEIHDWWDKQGGSARIAHDLNHYSLPWQGMR